MRSTLLKQFVLCISLALLPVAESLAAAGKFNFVVGDVRVVNAAGERKVERGSEVEASETIVSGSDGTAQLRMSDGAFISVRPDTELRIDQYQYNGKPDASSNTVLSLVKGTFRAFTGAIAIFNKDKFKMKTPTATIGIRGSGNVLNFSPGNNVTLNHTIEGSHTVTAVDLSGTIRTLVTMPGQTVQVNPNGVMQFVPTPAFMLNAATAAVVPRPQQRTAGGTPPGRGAGPAASTGTAGAAPGTAGAAPGTAGAAPGTAGAAPGTAGAAPGTAGAAPGTAGMAPGMAGTAPGIPGIPPGVPGVPGMPTGMPPGMAGVPTMDPSMTGGIAIPGMAGTAPGIAGMPPGIFGAPGMTTGMAPGTFGAPAMDLSMTGGMAIPGMPAGQMYASAMPVGTYTAPTMGVVYAMAMLGIPTYTAPTLNAATITQIALVTNFVDTQVSAAAGCTAANNFCATGTPAFGAIAGGCTPANNFCGTAAVTSAAAVTCDAACLAARVTAQTAVATGSAATGGCTALNNWCAIPVSGGVTATCDAVCVAANVAAGTVGAGTGGCTASNNWCGTTTVAAGTTCATNSALCGTTTVAGGCTAANNFCASGGTTCDAVCAAANAAAVALAACVANPASCTSATVVWGGACTGEGSVSGTLYCNGATWITPTVGTACTGTGTAGGFTCTNGAWATGSATPTQGGACTAAGSVSGSFYCNGTTLTWITPVVGGACTGTVTAAGFTCTNNAWATASATPAQGGACTAAGSVSGSFYCDGTTLTWITPVAGGACTGTVTAAGFTCSAGLWVTSGGTLLGTPGFIGGVPTPAPAAGLMYDAYAAQVTIPAAGYRHVSYVYPTISASTAMEISLDPQIVSAGGSNSFFNAPSSDGSASSSVNTATFSLGAALQFDFGVDPVSGMTWGRWQGSWITTNPTQGAVAASATSNLHWFASPTQTQAINLPRTGTFTYTYAGGTTPTDNNGTMGTLVSTPTFAADFTNQTVNVTLGVNMPASTGPIGPTTAVQMNATANSVPILPGANFKTNTPTVTCTGCMGTPSGVIGGQFSGQGGSGVGVGYGLKNGPQVINGAAVFHK